MWPDVVHRWKHAFNSSWCYRQRDKLSNMPCLCMHEHVHNYTECNSQMPVKVMELQALEANAIAIRLESWTTPPQGGVRRVLFPACTSQNTNLNSQGACKGNTWWAGNKFLHGAKHFKTVEMIWLMNCKQEDQANQHWTTSVNGRPHTWGQTPLQQKSAPH
jgi:hypothetical protein